MFDTMTLIIILATLGALSLGSILFAFSLHRRLRKLTKGRSGESLEGIIRTNNAALHDFKENQKIQKQEIQTLQSQIKKSIQHISVTRFDALNEMGGKQSFAIGLTDEHKNGVVISSMYTRDRMNVFAKEITKGTSKHTLTKEEESVIN